MTSSIPATTSYSGTFRISTSVSPPSRLHTRRVVIAKAEPSDKSVEIMRKFSEQYARKSDTFFCVDKSVTSVVIKLVVSNSEAITLVTQGLADHRDSLGAPLCPCRQVHYDDKEAEAKQGFWNCPCVPMRERKECHCMLFLTPDNDFAGDEQAQGAISACYMSQFGLYFLAKESNGFEPTASPPHRQKPNWESSFLFWEGWRGLIGVLCIKQ
ncbi:ferredoxin-thioredoxin reductase catalytic chain, chloroplastic [Tanacetum coccineum]